MNGLPRRVTSCSSQLSSERWLALHAEPLCKAHCKGKRLGPYNCPAIGPVIYVTQPLRIHRVQSEDGRAQSPAIGPPDDSDWGTRGFPPSHRPTRPTGGGSGGKYLATASMARR